VAVTPSIFTGAIMDKRTKEGKLAAIGKEYLDKHVMGISRHEEMLIETMATMIVASSVKKTPKTVSSSAITGKFLDTIRDQCPEGILWEPFNKSWYGRLGAVLKQLPDVTLDDARLVAQWINAGRFWIGNPSFSAVIPQIGSIIAEARRAFEGDDNTDGRYK
jgi:hypothetical protein